MPREVEMKAHVASPEALTALLDEKTEFIREYRKIDLYLEGTVPPKGELRQMRLREDNGEWFVTFKEKTLTGGLEVNKEEEFPVKDPEVVEKVARKLGWREKVRKVKTGRQYRRDGLLYELSLVETLGWFLEVEALLPDGADSPEAIRKAEASVKNAFADLSLPPKAIEPRYYTEMLLSKG